LWHLWFRRRLFEDLDARVENDKEKSPHYNYVQSLELCAIYEVGGGSLMVSMQASTMTKKAKPIIFIVLRTLIEAMAPQLWGTIYIFSPAFVKLGHNTRVRVDVRQELSVTHHATYCR
jgi:hypothetical protein